jgi:hypothetical protein
MSPEWMSEGIRFLLEAMRDGGEAGVSPAEEIGSPLHL